MTQTNQNIRVYRGDTATLTIAVTQADGQPLDPGTNPTVEWRMARNWHSPEAEVLVRKEPGEGMTLATGLVEIALETADTDHPPGLYYHELKIWDADEAATSMTGVVVIKPAMRMVEEPTP